MFFTTRRQGIAALICVAALLSLQGGSEASGQSVTPAVEVVVTSSDLTQALMQLPDVSFGGPPAPGTPIIDVDDAVHYQRVDGFGAAMTDTSAWLIHDELAPAEANAVIADLFGSGGIHLNFIRVPMGGSDFTADRVPYTYDDLPSGRSDPGLMHFSIAHDEAYIIPVLRQALALNPGATVLANPWSPPAWMKHNDALDDSYDHGWLLPSMYEPLANYFVKFLRAYARSGIPVTAITPQNEPENPSQYPGMDLNEPSEASFVMENLVPALQAADLRPQIYGYDYGWSTGSLPYAEQLLFSRAVSVFDGLATHCYFGSPTALDVLHALAPRLREMVSECSPGITPYPTSELLISAMRNWASTVALWNYALDPNGGPVEPPNTGCWRCTGMVTINEATHTAALTRDYYQLGQVSKFVAPGAVRIASSHFVHYGYAGRGKNIASAGVDDVAFLNPDRSEVLVAFNNGTVPTTFAVDWKSHYFTQTLAPGTTATYIWN